MRKVTALTLLGGNTNHVGARVGCTGAAIRKWPDELPARLVDRVVAAVVRELVKAGAASGRRRPDRITLPFELVRHLLWLEEHPSFAILPNEDDKLQQGKAGLNKKTQRKTTSSTCDTNRATEE
jgi:hypothetical protein